MLKIDDIHTYYGESYVLQGISLEVGEGSVVGILGRNGMGKTTLIRSIVGFTPPRRGRIFFKGIDIT
ncbi:MAG: ATP-binding cassette domain-containing protein, partial [Nitrospirota bacterium]